ncbi:MAG: hypothetical protein ACRC2T_11060 [Thermoguttaceae bacterium]
MKKLLASVLLFVFAFSANLFSQDVIGLPASNDLPKLFRGKVVFADRPEEGVPGAKIFWYTMGKNSYGQGVAKTAANGEFIINDTNTTDLLAIVYYQPGMENEPESEGIDPFDDTAVASSDEKENANKEPMLCGCAVFAIEDSPTIKLGHGKAINGKMISAGDDAKPFENVSLSCALLITDKSGSSRLHTIGNDRYNLNKSLPSLNDVKTDSEGKFTFAPLPEAPEDIAEFGYYLVINAEIEINGQTQKSQNYYRPLTPRENGEEETLQLDRSELEVRDYYLENFVFPYIQNYGPDANEDAVKRLLDQQLTAIKGKDKPVLLLLYNPGKDMDEYNESRTKVGNVLKTFLYDPNLSEAVKKYYLTGLKTGEMQYIPEEDGSYRYEPRENVVVTELAKSLKPGLENVDFITLCILDKDGNLLMSQPLNMFIGKAVKSNREVDELIPELLLPLLEAFAE